MPYEHYGAATRPRVTARVAAFRAGSKRDSPLPAVYPLGVTLGEAVVGVGVAAATAVAAVLFKDDREGSGLSRRHCRAVCVYALATRHVHPATLVFWDALPARPPLALSPGRRRAGGRVHGARWVRLHARGGGGCAVPVGAGAARVDGRTGGVVQPPCPAVVVLAVARQSHPPYHRATGMTGALHGAAAITDGLAMVPFDRLVLGVAYEALFRYQAVTAEAVITALPAGVVRIAVPGSPRVPLPWRPVGPSPHPGGVVGGRPRLFPLVRPAR